MDEYRSFRLELYRGADVFLVCFDIGRPATLHNVIHKVTTWKWNGKILNTLLQYEQHIFVVVIRNNS
jgi:GTPase SAR1 family protein